MIINAFISETSISINVVGGSGDVTVLASETRPLSLAKADTMLSAHGYGRTEEWDLTLSGGVAAEVKQVDNLFNGVRAARLDQAVGTTHDEFEYDQARNVENGDLISDGEISEIYVVGGSSTDGDVTKIHMVQEGKVWDDRFTGHFMPGQLVKRARKR